MTELLLRALERFPPRVRRVVVAVGALLALGAVMTALSLTTPSDGHRRRSIPPGPATASSPNTPARRLRPPVSVAQLAVARRVAARFLAGYLPFAYGRGSALTIGGVTPALRRQLVRRQRAQLTPVERRRRPRVVSLQTVATTPLFVVATVSIDDGGVATYRLRFTVSHFAGRWAVGSVEEG
jgi:hypothetical protein